MAGKERKIGKKINRLLLISVLGAMLTVGAISLYSLYSMKRISTEHSKELGTTAADDAEEALENLAVENLQNIAEQRAAAIEEKFGAVEACVLGIATQARHIYEHPDQYPDRVVNLPVPDSHILAAQLLWSEKLENQIPDAESGFPTPTEEVLKLGNLQDMLVQYNANNSMIASTYIATETGWMIQADYISYSKYSQDGTDAARRHPLYMEAKDRQWYKRAAKVGNGRIVYTDVIRDYHEGGDCIVCASPVYRDEKLVAVAGIGLYLQTVNDVVLSTDVGDGGYAFLLNENGQVLVSGRMDGETAAYAEKTVDLRESNNLLLAQAAADMTAGKTGAVELILDKREAFLAYAPLKKLGWSMVTVIDKEKVVAPAYASQQIILALTGDMGEKQDNSIHFVIVAFVVTFVCMALAACASGAHFSGRLTEPIYMLADEVMKWDGSDLGYRVCLQTGDELEELGDAFNSMIEQIQQYVDHLASITTEKERIRTEIQVAARLQADMLPEVSGIFANRDDLILAATMVPAKGVGGDLYDFFLLDEERLVLVVADVSGKGVPAALFMVVSRTMIRSRLMKLGREEALSTAVEEVNRALCENNKDGMFVTAWIGVLNVVSGEVDFVNAGHCRPLVRRKGGDCQYDITFSGMMLAGMEETTYRQGKLELSKGDLLLLYTDGVTEAANPEEELYGEERLLHAVENAGNAPPEELLGALWKAVDDFQGGSSQSDDITMLALAWRGSGFDEKTGIPVMENMQEFIDFVETMLSDRDVSAKTSVKIHVAVDEIFSNICYYSGATEVTVGIRVKDRREDGKTAGQEITIYFEDDGIPYDPLGRPDPDVNELLGRRKEGGLGIYLVKKRMDRVEYEYINDRNRLTIYKVSEE